MDYLLGQSPRKDIVNRYGVIVIPAGSIITKQSLRLIELHKVDPALIHLNLEESTYVEEYLVKEVTRCVDDYRHMFELTAVTGKVPLIEIRKQIVPIVTELGQNFYVFELFDAVKAKDEYTYVHNVGVAVLSSLIGKWLGLQQNELNSLALAGLLHDVGKIKLPSELLTKPGKLTDEEYALVKKHTIYGYEILKNTPGVSSKIARVALQHHEREDGKGYPLGLLKNHIDYFSSIVAVADIFHAMSSVRPYHDALSFHEIITQMNEGRFGALNPHIVSVFIENTMRGLIGQRVLLDNGMEGEVIYLNPHAFDRPLIKTEDSFIDLEKVREVHISKVLLSP